MTERNTQKTKQIIKPKIKAVDRITQINCGGHMQKISIRLLLIYVDVCLRNPVENTPSPVMLLTDYYVIRCLREN